VEQDAAARGDLPVHFDDAGPGQLLGSGAFDLAGARRAEYRTGRRVTRGQPVCEQDRLHRHVTGERMQHGGELRRVGLDGDVIDAARRDQRLEQVERQHPVRRHDMELVDRRPLCPRPRPGHRSVADRRPRHEQRVFLRPAGPVVDGVPEDLARHLLPVQIAPRLNVLEPRRNGGNHPRHHKTFAPALNPRSPAQ
jgi:hypothetical protein